MIYFREPWFWHLDINLTSKAKQEGKNSYMSKSLYTKTVVTVWLWGDCKKKNAKGNNLLHALIYLVYKLWRKLHVPQIQVLYREWRCSIIFFSTKISQKICSVNSGEVKFKDETNHSLLLTKGLATESIVPEPFLFLKCAQGNKEKHGSGWIYIKLFKK